MHTYVLSKVISEDMYNNILSTTPYYQPDNYISIIRNNLLKTIPKDEIKSLPVIYLIKTEDTKVINGKTVKTGKVFYTLNLRINYLKLLGGTGFYSIPTQMMKTLACDSIIDLVCRAIPEVYECNNDLLFIRSELEQLFQQEYPNQPIPDMIDMVTVFATSTNKIIQRYMNKKFAEPELFSLPIKREAKQKLIDQHYPLTFKLKRMDFACDIYTDFKIRLLELIKQGYDVKAFSDGTRVYCNDITHIIETNYYVSNSVTINIYDKEAELKAKNKPIPLEDEHRIPYLLRFEVQAQKRKIHNLKNKEQAKTGLEIERTLDEFVNGNYEYENLNYYMKRIIGEGNYYEYDTAIDIINNSNLKNNMKQKLIKVIKHVSKRQGIANFLKAVAKGIITDCGKLTTAKDYLKRLHEMGINPVTLSRRQVDEMKQIQQQYPMPDIGQYRYGVDFLYNPLFYLEIQQQIVKQSANTV